MFKRLMLCALPAIPIAGLAAEPVASPRPQRPHYLMTYFDGEADGAKLALSEDGLRWRPVNGGKPVVRPEGKDLVRDPSILRGPDGRYRMVWTTGWTGRDIGYAVSDDLIVWSKPRKIPVMAGKAVSHSWAPELFYDVASGQHMILWSSDSDIWSIYYVTTKDFETFSEPRILFTNGGQGGGKAGNTGPIDAYIVKDPIKGHILFYKKDDNTGVPNLYHRFGKTALGPWGQEQGPITPSTGDEGPSVIRRNGEYWIYTDPLYRPVIEVYRSKDLRHWRKQSTNLRGQHGSVITVSAAEAERLTSQ